MGWVQFDGNDVEVNSQGYSRTDKSTISMHSDGIRGTVAVGGAVAGGGADAGGGGVAGAGAIPTALEMPAPAQEEMHIWSPNSNPKCPICEGVFTDPIDIIFHMLGDHDSEVFEFSIKAQTVSDIDETEDGPKFILSDGSKTPMVNEDGDIELGIKRFLGLIILSDMVGHDHLFTEAKK
jgi:hypothetical protein